MLQIKNLFVKYIGAKTASVGDVSFEVEKGDRVAILGPSGCGKSTTLNVIAGLLTEKEAEIKGEINWNASTKKSYTGNGAELPKIELSSQVSKPIIRMVFQEATLLPWRTVEKNIAFGLEIKKISKEEIAQKVSEMLRIIGLEEFAKSYPHQLSVGMQQRVNFARALVCEPDLLLLDEPFSALDVETKKIIQEEFLKIIKEKNITSIFVTHNVQEAAFMANKIVILSSSPSLLRVILNDKLILNTDKILHFFNSCDI